MMSPKRFRIRPLVWAIAFIGLAASTGCVSKATRVFGSRAVLQGRSVSAAKLSSHPSEFDGQRIVVGGTIARVSASRGKWFLFGVPQDGAPILVLLDTEGLSIPRNSANHTARASGTVELHEFVPGEPMEIGGVRMENDGSLPANEMIRVVVLHADGVAIDEPFDLEPVSRPMMEPTTN